MELKWSKGSSFGSDASRSNRTFMELKLKSFQQRYLQPQVLIVPLWNWNMTMVHEIMHGMKVLIVPLWNWNSSTINGYDKSFGSNRTFMELKLIMT